MKAFLSYVIIIFLSLSFFQFPCYAGYDNIEDANNDRIRRENNLICGWLVNFIKEQNKVLPPWNERGNAINAVNYMAAVLYVLAYPDRFDDPGGQYWEEVEDFISERFTIIRETGDDTTILEEEVGALEFYQIEFTQYLENIEYLADVGTRVGKGKGDYDMVLLSLVNLLYLFRDRPDILTNEMAYLIICHGECEESVPRYTFTKGTNYLIKQPDPPWRWFQPETENHMLMILTWNYLVTQWIMNQEAFGRGDNRFYRMSIEKRSLYQSILPGMNDLLLQVVGRVVHNGLFETNARPYQHYSLLALFTLANYAGAPGSGNNLIRQGARNAFNYLATKFAFQSLNGKRSAPRRRNREQKKSMGFYTHDDVPLMFGMLSGAYEFRDCYNYLSCMFNWKELNGNKALWMAFSDYELPRPIHAFMLKKPTPFYARMQARYTDRHYPLGFASPKYFNSRGEPIIMIGNFRGSPELYFGTNEFLLSAGGMYRAYFWGSHGNLKNYRFHARPTMLITRGDFGDDWDYTYEKDHKMAELDRVKKDVMIILGKQNDYEKSKCNLWVYKNFVYCYKYFDNGAKRADKDWRKEWPQEFPPKWDSHLKQQFNIDDSANFRIYEFKPNTRSGYYVTAAKIRKEHRDGIRNHPRHLNYRRGWIEIVPGDLFENSQLLKNEIIALNAGKDYFSKRNSSKSWYYTMASTKERVKLWPKMGSQYGGWEDCTEGIQAIQEYNDFSGRFEDQNMADIFLPKDVSNEGDLRRIPLITVWELDSRYKTTDRKYVVSVANGKILIIHPIEGSFLIDSSRYQAPNESYNCFNVCADLEVKSITITPPSPTTGDTIKFEAAIKNRGNLASPATEATISIGNETPHPQYVPGLVPGDWCTIEKKRGFELAGNYEVIVSADSGEKIVEWDEDNNIKTKHFTVSESQTLKVVFPLNRITDFDIDNNDNNRLKIKVIFNRPVNRISVESSLKVNTPKNPNAPGSCQWINDNEFIWASDDPIGDLCEFGSGCSFSLTITDSAKDINGNRLDGDKDGNPGGNFKIIFTIVG